MPRFRMGVCYDFRNPPDSGTSDRAWVPQSWIVGDVDQCVSELAAFIEDFGITDIVTMAVPPGLRAAQMSTSLERLFKEVVPKLKQVVDNR